MRAQRWAVVMALGVTLLVGCSTDRTECEAKEDLDRAREQLDRIDVENESAETLNGAVDDIRRAAKDLLDAQDIDDTPELDALEQEIETVRALIGSSSEDDERLPGDLVQPVEDALGRIGEALDALLGTAPAC